jgi:trans-aconitate methyltransferase
MDTWNADRYDRSAAFVSSEASDLVDVLSPRAGEEILDLGCGTGTLSARIAAKGARVLGLDSSPAMIERAKISFPKVAFTVGDGQRLEFSAQYDAVFSNAALHWMPDAAAVAAGIRRALRPNGRFVVEFGGYGNVATPIAAVDHALSELGIDLGEWQNWYFPKLGAYASLLEQHGFVVHAAHLFGRPTPVADEGGRSGLAVWLDIFAAELMRRCADRSADLVRIVEDRCRSRLFRDGKWQIDYVRLRMVASASA